MARINNDFELLCDELHRASVASRRVDKTSAAGKASRARPAPLRKSAPAPSLRDVLAKAQAANFAGKVAVSKIPKPAGMPNVGDTPEPAILRHEALKQAAAHDDLNSPISEQMLHRVLKMAKAGQLRDEQARRTVEHHSKGLALPTDVMHAVASYR
jgi:hypothetical protein